MARIARYSEETLAAEWRAQHGLEAAGSAELSTGEYHLEALLSQRLRRWYASLLAEAPAERLPVRDLKGNISEARLLPTGALMIRLPREGFQLVEVMMPEWEKPVRTFHTPGSPAALRQRDGWRRSTPKDPVVIRDGDTLYIYGVNEIEPAAAGQGVARLERLLMTAWPEGGYYEFDIRDFPDDEI